MINIGLADNLSCEEEFNRKRIKSNITGNNHKGINWGGTWILIPLDTRVFWLGWVGLCSNGSKLDF